MDGAATAIAAGTDTAVDTATVAAAMPSALAAAMQDAELTAAPIVERPRQRAVTPVADTTARLQRPAADSVAAAASTAAVAAPTAVADTGNPSNSAASPRSRWSSSTKPVCF